MRKLLTLLLALLMLTCTAFAEDADELMALDFEDFTIAIRKDAVGTGTDTIEDNVPFLMVYQDYDPEAVFNKGMNIVWTEDVLDLSNADPKAYVNEILNYSVQEYSAIGLGVDNVRIYEAEIDALDEKDVLSYIYSMDLDYTPLGFDYQATLYTLQASVPLKGVGTYTFTVTTDDLENSQELIDIVDSVRWK